MNITYIKELVRKKLKEYKANKEDLIKIKFYLNHLNKQKTKEQILFFCLSMQYEFELFDDAIIKNIKYNMMN